jgi:peptidoglycan/xylan/chitin deacetylase (PgdA/CDA1 family)
MGADYLPYRARRGDVAKLGEPFRFGEETALIEMPISWSLDDFPHFEFMRTATTILPGLQPARLVMQNWLDEFLYMKKSIEWGVLTYTMHPYVIGRGHRMLALEDLVDRLVKEGAVFATMEEAARDWARPDRRTTASLPPRDQFAALEAHLRKFVAVLAWRHARMTFEQISEKADVFIPDF